MNFDKPNNPHNSSIIPEKLKLDPVSKENGSMSHQKAVEYKDVETNDVFFKKHYWGGVREMHLREHFTSLLTKGILHSSEMVRVGNNDFFSRKINLNETQTGAPFEKEAEIFILNTILGDHDRGIDQPNHNMEQDENGKFNHYDFGASFTSGEFREIHKNSKNAQKIFYEFCKENKFSKEDIYNFSLQILNKLDKLEQAVSDGKFISAILDKTGFEPPEDIVDISQTKKIIQNMKKYINYESTSKDAQSDKIMRIKKLLLTPIKAMKKVVKPNLE